ncbi:hypothetical protein EIB72_06525 [Burkholderia ambifaria]|uniref:hypothetical protein n=1 Tax=Burkholderia ambifaria TaxID=152480 RepID=UPI0013FD32AC|nr:hypothetical protein [Burkholderia ambifaria]NHL66038.1 hypothetical protein [Burkholderia ambifaria]
MIRADEAKNNSIRSEMLRAAIEWQELRRCCLPDRPAYRRRAGLTGRTPPTTGRMPLRPLAGRPDALPRERRVCYRKLAPSAALSSWKTDLDQFVDTATPSPEASIRAA